MELINKFTNISILFLFFIAVYAHSYVTLLFALFTVYAVKKLNESGDSDD